MGVAAYYRGNRVISAQHCRDRGCGGCLACQLRSHVTPRPPGWGDKARARALAFAVRFVRWSKARGCDLDAESLALAIRDNVRCGKRTAADAAAEAIRTV